MAEIEVYKRVVDYVGLNVKPVPERFFELWKDLQPTLALLQGMGADGAKLVNVDANGNLLVSTASQPSDTFVNIDKINGVAPGYAPADAAAQPNAAAIPVSAFLELFNNAAYDRGRSASAANLAAKSGLGAALVSEPGEWTVSSTPAAGNQASATQAAGGVGVRNVCKSVTFSAGSVVAPALTFLTISLRDGASGVGTLLRTWIAVISAATGQNVPPIDIAGLHIVGSPNTAMTVEWSAGLANLQESCSMSGYAAA